MKEKILDEFGYKVDLLAYHKEYISFFYNGYNYIVQNVNQTETEIINLAKIVEYIEHYQIFFHEIVKGKNDYIFNYGNNNYVLLRLRICCNREITLNEILHLTSIDITKLDIPQVDFGQRIANKIDFIEQYIANYEKNYALEDLSYYLGLSETAIELLNMLNVPTIAIGHKRLRRTERTLDFYNPLNIVVDNNCRDLAEYVKNCYFMHNENLIFEMLKYIKLQDWSFYFARLLYPSYYFDCLEDIIIKNYEIECQKKISIKANDYEMNLKILYNEIRKYINLPFIEWLSDVNNF